MRKFKQHKLWRDLLITMMEKEYGSKIHWRRLDDEEFDKELRKKLREEMEEVCAAKNRNELINELADLYEVIDTLADLHKISKMEIVSAQTEKRTKRGGFIKRHFVEIAEHPEGSYGETYCLADPEKYPEVI